MAAAALLGLWAADASALSLGRITVQSALGEPLRAEIDIPIINSEEAASIKAVAATPDAFRAAGLEYHPAMAGLQATLLRRVDGRAYLRLSSDRAINDPFLDMILVTSWATGRIVRDYTLLFDPPSMRQTTPVAPTPAQVPEQPAVRVAPVPAQPMASAAQARPAPTAAEPAKASAKAVAAKAKPEVRMAATPEPSQAKQLVVKAGDTAGRIAAANRPANISLDQMLVALLRANPSAFLDDNVNRIKAGAVIDVPSAEQAGATAPASARQMIVAQAKDFNDFRRKLANNAPEAKVAAADRKVSGSVQAKVEDKKPAATAPDKLTLSKGAVKGVPPAEDKLAQERSAKEAASRAAEIEKNIAELGKLSAASSAAAQSTPAAPAVSTEPTPAVVAATTPPQAAVSEMATPAVAVPAVPALAESASQSGPSIIDDLIENPLMPAGAAGLIALLVAVGVYRSRQNRKASQMDSVLMESRLQPDSFFGASGGQSVDTSDSTATGSSMVYTASQLDAVDDVDPVAEADVYLAYGRDLQAEEILRDALRSHPERIAIHQKLLEIFAKRRDPKAYREVAVLAYRQTGGSGADWEQICERGLTIDPDNGLYQPGGQPESIVGGTPSRPAELSDATLPVHDFDNVPTHGMAPPSNAELDLDLDFSVDEEPASAITETTASGTAPDINLQESDSMPAAFDLDFGADSEPGALSTEAAADPSAVPAETPLDFSIDSLAGETGAGAIFDASDNEEFKRQAAASFGATGPAPLPETQPEASATPDMSMLEFDLGSLSLDLEKSVEASAPTPSTAEATDVHEDPLETKLALADEFSAIGDDDGARSLIEEVLSEATGEMKAKAQRALSKL